MERSKHLVKVRQNVHSVCCLYACVLRRETQFEKGNETLLLIRLRVLWIPKHPKWGALSMKSAINPAAAFLLCKGGSYQMSRDLLLLLLEGCWSSDREKLQPGTSCHARITIPLWQWQCRYRMKDSVNTAQGKRRYGCIHPHSSEIQSTATTSVNKSVESSSNREGRVERVGQQAEEEGGFGRCREGGGGVGGVYRTRLASICYLLFFFFDKKKVGKRKKKHNMASWRAILFRTKTCRGTFASWEVKPHLLYWLSLLVYN